ncbi:MAG: two component transcriptional regulator, two-component system, OmpR family, response regulator [Candidatus Taylorbacteria bacterium]|nr:two component transcriptional regulator, two-component system, OmpR family, response regulator [Candidatus Taylorbacteria bacterium]
MEENTTTTNTAPAEAKKKFNIMIVDDDKFILSMYTMKFTKEGMDVISVSRPTEALEKLRTGLKPDIVLLDVIMPEMDGIELLAKIREENLAEGSVVIILSNQGQPSDIDRAKAFGINGYIVKATTIPSEVLRQITDIAKENGK